MWVTAEQVTKFSTQARADLVQAIVDHAADAAAAGIDTPLRVQHFMTQVATETGGMKRLDENLVYSAARLLVVFADYVTPAEAPQLAGHAEATGNHVYANRLGNGDVASGDGFRYRGSGFVQLTGRDNFRKRGQTIGIPLETNPELARTPAPGFQAATAYWTAQNINVAADADDLVHVRKLVNGGTRGLAEARIWIERARRFFGIHTVDRVLSEKAELRAVQELLAELGFLDRQLADGTQSATFVQALLRFQSDQGLSPTGKYDAATLDALTNLPGATAQTVK